MAVKLETQSIRTIATFEKLTKVHARDCLITDECIYFLVDPERIGMAVGRNGSIIKEVRRVFGKSVKIFGYYPDPESFLRGAVPNVKFLGTNDGSITISIPNDQRMSVIGRNGDNIKAIREILSRHYKVKKLRLR